MRPRRSILIAPSFVLYLSAGVPVNLSSTYERNARPAASWPCRESNSLGLCTIGFRHKPGQEFDWSCHQVHLDFVSFLSLETEREDTAEEHSMSPKKHIFFVLGYFKYRWYKLVTDPGFSKQGRQAKLFGKILAQNCMKMKEIGTLWEGVPGSPWIHECKLILIITDPYIF